MQPSRAALLEAIDEIHALASTVTDNRERLQDTLDGIREVISDLYNPANMVKNAHHSR